jgi:putative colanic acid biosynthesis UDP-glucose lipid carrier transferase
VNQKQLSIYFLIQWIFGGILISLLYFYLTIRRIGGVTLDDGFFLICLLVANLFLYSQSNVYLNKSRFDLFVKILVQWLLAICICITIAFILKLSNKYSRLVIFQLCIFGFILQLFGYFFIKRVFIYFGMNPIGVSNVVVVGKINFNKNFSNELYLKRNEYLIGYIERENQSIVIFKGVDLNDEVREISLSHEIFDIYGIKKIYLTASATDYKGVIDDYYKYSIYPVEIDWYLQTSDQLAINDFALLTNFPFVQLTLGPNNPTPLYDFIKRGMDLLLGSILVVLLSPLLICVALLIKITSSGPVIFKQRRHGLYGTEITVYKFRSMYEHNSDRLVQATKGDYRITPLGKFLRTTSIDELPQLFNVLNGSLSLVGPRPHPVEFDSYYGNSIREYMMRHRIKPGITGLAQVFGARGATETTEKMMQRIKLDLKYINNRSMLLDIKILLLTPIALIAHKGE